MSTLELDTRYPVGAEFDVSGDSAEMWIQDYNVRVCTTAEILEQPTVRARKVYVKLAEIDNDANVCVFINKRFLKNRVKGGIIIW